YSSEILETDTANVLPPEDDTNTQSAQIHASLSKKVKVSKIDLFDKSSSTNDVLFILLPLPIVVIPSLTSHTSNPLSEDVVPSFSKSASTKSIVHEEASTTCSIFSTCSISSIRSISSACDTSTRDISTIYRAFTIRDASTICKAIPNNDQQSLMKLLQVCQQNSAKLDQIDKKQEDIIEMINEQKN
ncbi:8969_t:CDS:2, partial [Funneliformis caledonium]